MSRYRSSRDGRPPAQRLSDRWVSRFGDAPDPPSDSVWSEEQCAIDDRKVELLALGLLRIHDSSHGGLETPDAIWLVSRTTMSVAESEVLPGCKPAHELVGGWVTRKEALLEFPQEEELTCGGLEYVAAA